MHQVVEAVRHPAPPPEIPDTFKNFTDITEDIDPTDVASLRVLVDRLVAIQGRVGLLALQLELDVVRAGMAQGWLPAGLHS